MRNTEKSVAPASRRKGVAPAGRRPGPIKHSLVMGPGLRPAGTTMLFFSGLLLFCQPLYADLGDRIANWRSTTTATADVDAPQEPPKPEWATWGQFDTEKGFLVANTPKASMRITGYILLRYMNQLPADQSFTDHLGNTHDIHTRSDFSAPHRVLLNFTGFMFDPKFLYTATIWTVNAINTVAVIGHLDYLFNKHFNLSGGVGSMPGSRTLTYSHPYWLGSDRVMADDFFRPGFTQGI